MKKFLYTCFGLSLLLGACSDNEEAPQATIQLSSSSQLVNIASDGKSGTVQFDATAGSAAITVKTNQQTWTASSTGTWCKAIQEGDKLTISVDANATIDDLDATVTLTAGSGKNQALATIKVKQLGKDKASLTLTSQSPLVEMAPDGLSGTVAFELAGGQAEITIASNQPEWSYEAEGDDWCEIVKGEGKLTISATANPKAETRNATVTLNAGEQGNMATVVLTITQEAQEAASLTVDPAPIEIPASGAWQEVTITTNQSVWDVTGTADWLTIEKGDGKFTVKAKSNYTRAARNTSITVTAGEGQNIATQKIEVSQPRDEKLMILLVKPAAGTIALQLDGIVDAKISWGDGSPVETVTTTFPTHIYADQTQEYEVAISGMATKLNANNSAKFNAASKKSILAVKQWGNITLTDMRGAFYQCSNLTELAANPGNAFALVNTMMQAFYQCTVLKNIPEGLFDNSPDITTFQYAFQECKAIESIPATLFLKTPKVTTFASTFSGCTALKAIPAGMFDAATAEGLTFAGTFSNCTTLTEIPARLFDKCVNATTFSSAFDGCKNITAIPAGLFRNNSKANFMASVFASTGITEIPAGLFDAITAPSVNIGSCFKNCKALESIPADLFDKCVHITTFANTFDGCSALKSIPAGLFSKNTEVTIVSSVFANCTQITSIPEGLFDTNVKVFNAMSCFSGCTGLESIPAALFSKCPAITMITGAFLNCTSLTSIPASLFDNNRKIYKLDTTFSGCKALTGESPYTMITVDGTPTKVHLYERSKYPDEFAAVTAFTGCFKNCTGLSDYTDISTNYKGWY